MMTSRSNENGGTPKVNGGTQLVRINFNGSIALWDGKSAFCTILHPADYSSDELGDHFTLPVKDGAYDLSGLSRYFGSVEVEDLGNVHAGPDSIPAPIPSPEEGFVMEPLPEAKPIDQVIEDIAKAHGLDSIFDFNADGPPLYDQEPPNNRLN